MKKHDEAQLSRDSETSVHSRATQIDRLVSGDLSETERLELLSWLDESPERWRRCGVAFLEAQAVRVALAEIDAESRPRRSQTVAAPRLSALRLGAGVVALLLAFALGWGARRGVQAPAEEAVADGQVGVLPDAIDVSPVTAERNDVADAGPRDGLAMLRFSTGSGAEAREFSIPVRLADGAIEVLEQPAELPEYVRQQWERKGYHVSRQRRMLQLTMNDGRQVDLPVGQVLLTYVGQPML
jgi:anti-sigma factor RsiW